MRGNNNQKKGRGDLPVLLHCCLSLCVLDTIMTPTFLILRLYILVMYAVLTHGANCGQSEYRSRAGECCPMCNIGEVVLRDCYGDYSTTCQPCLRGTYMNEPNGLTKCFPCKTCDAGLYILKECTIVKNTVCEVLDGHFCMEYFEGECIHVRKHGECKPGQRLKTPGTKTSDTVCEPCPPGFYSPEGVNCSKWTDCSVNNEIEDQEGTSTIDVKCKPRERDRRVLLAALLIFILVLVILLCLYHAQAKKRKELKRPVEETNPNLEQSCRKREVDEEEDSQAVT